MLPNINFYSGGNIKHSLPSANPKNRFEIQKNDKIYKDIENRLNLQNEELNARAKVIEELKTSLSIFIDKYNKLKSDFEKEKQFGLQLSMNFRNSQSKAGKRIINNNNNYYKNLKISHFSHYFSKGKKKKSKIEAENDKLNKVIENLKKDFNNKENEWNLNLNKIKSELEEYKNKYKNLQNNIEEKNNNLNNNLNNYKSQINEYKQKIQNLLNENDNLKKEITTIKNNNQNNLNKTNDLINKIGEYKNTINNFKENENKLNEIIKNHKNEIERLKKDAAFNYKLIKDENNDLLNQINNLNDKLLLLTNQQNINTKNKKFEILKISRIICHTISLNNNNKVNIKELEEKIKNLNKENSKLKKEINSIIKEKNSLNEKLKNLKNNQKENGKSFNNNIKNIKDQIANIYEKFNINFIETKNNYEEKIKKIEKKNFKYEKEIKSYKFK